MPIEYAQRPGAAGRRAQLDALEESADDQTWDAICDVLELIDQQPDSAQARREEITGSNGKRMWKVPVRSASRRQSRRPMDSRLRWRLCGVGRRYADRKIVTQAANQPHKTSRHGPAVRSHRTWGKILIESARVGFGGRRPGRTRVNIYRDASCIYWACGKASDRH